MLEGLYKFLRICDFRSVGFLQVLNAIIVVLFCEGFNAIVRDDDFVARLKCISAGVPHAHVCM